MIKLQNIAILSCCMIMLNTVTASDSIDTTNPICYKDVPSTADRTVIDKFKIELDSWAIDWWNTNNKTAENNKPPQAKINISCDYTKSKCDFSGSESADEDDKTADLKLTWTLKKDGELIEISDKDIDDKKMIFTHTFPTDLTAPGAYVVELKVADPLQKEAITTENFYYGIGQTEQELWVSDVQEKSGNFKERLYIPTYKERKIIVFNSKGAYQIVYPGCAELGQVLLNDPCRHDGSIEPNIIYSQRLDLVDGIPPVGANNPIRFNMDDGSDAWEFSKSISWLPGDMKSYAPTSDLLSIQYYTEKDYKEKIFIKGANNLDQCITNEWEMNLKYDGSLPAISTCDLIPKIAAQEKSRGEKIPLQGKRIIYVNFTTADSDIKSYYYNDSIFTKSDALSSTNSYCNDNRTFKQQKEGEPMQCEMNLADYCGNYKQVKLKYLMGSAQKTLKVNQPVECYFILSAW